MAKMSEKSQLNLAIRCYTYKFRKFYKLYFCAGTMYIYERRNQYGGMKVVVVCQTSDKCYRVIFGDGWNVANENYNKSNYCSFRSQFKLCQYLDELV